MRSTTSTRLALFAGVLVGIFAVATLAGAAIGPETEEDDGEMAPGEHPAPGSHEGSGSGSAVPGLAVAEAGLRLELGERRYEPGTGRELSFRILGPDGEPLTDYVTEHEREMHLILVRRDFEEFQHLHPSRGADGSWSVDADLVRPGAYRVFADFATSEGPRTLGADLFVAGDFDPQPLPASEAKADAGDGYEVSLEEADGALRFAVARDGRPIKDVEPYLGADGHLVALREGDLAFLHTHPEGEAGGPIEVGVEYPSPGRYRLFLQFKHDGEVRTAAFTREVDDASSH